MVGAGEVCWMWLEQVRCVGCGGSIQVFFMSEHDR